MAVSVGMACAEESSLPPLKGNIAPASSPNELFTAQPSGLPVVERENADKSGVTLAVKDSAKTWTLPELVDEALKRNPATSQAWKSAQSSEADVAVARSAYYPTVTLSASGGPSHNTSANYPGTSTTDQWSGGPALSVQYLLLDFGARKANVEASRFALLSKNFDFNQQLQTVALNVMTNYYNVDYTRASVDDAEASLALAKSTLESTDIRSKVGLAAVTDVYQARQNVAKYQYNLENAKGSYSKAKVQLLTSVGMAGNSKLEVAPPAELPSTKVLQEEEDKLIDRALRQRPDLASKYAAWRQQLALSNKAEADRWPTLTSGVSLERDFYSAHMNPGEGQKSYNGDGHTDSAAALLTFSWNVFDGGNKSNAAKSAKLQAEAYKAALAQAELSAISDVVVNFIAFKTAVKAVDAAQALVDSAQQSYDSVNISYKSGLKNITDLLTVQSDLASAKTSLSESRSALYTAAASLANATGDIIPRPSVSTNNTSRNTPSDNSTDTYLPLPAQNR